MSNKYTNSPLVDVVRLTNNKTNGRNHVIDTITIHCIVGQWTAQKAVDYFATTKKQASCNYAVGCDGKVGLCVEEKDRSWCSSSKSNDNRAITIEVASDTKHPYAVNDKAYNKLIELVADICKRNGIKKLVWSTNKVNRVNHLNECNMTCHRDFKSSKSCPGEYLYSRHGEIANRVNAILNGSDKKTFRVNIKDDVELNIRAGAGMQYKINGVIKDHGIYTIVEVKNGHWGKLKSGAGWISIHEKYVDRLD